MIFLCILGQSSTCKPTPWCSLVTILYLNHSSSLQPTSAAMDTPVTVHAKATFILPPLSESVLPVYSKTALPVGSTGLIEPNSKLAERYHVCGASQLVSLSEHHAFPFRVLNPTTQPVTIYRCSTMGTYTPSAASMSVIATADTSMPPPPVSNPSQRVPLDLSSTPLTEVQQASGLSLQNIVTFLHCHPRNLAVQA